ncbi:protoheme IX farnesyltransferase [Haloferula luteola]|uniref:Protoheme IX farnesyltransferase n=1 Tax=Haloferula luteola TaxID=595692 RepID=A0A840V9U2_9BACT|nr:heme o synthase [Haloferula luteola]MBB5352344.1 protoheme IX farnesyltransferase [Haloferula luteola]
MSEEETTRAADVKPGLRQDLMVLMKVRLNVFVLITTFFGYLLASKASGIDGWQLANTLIGTALAAFGSAAFNQLMEVDLDARMRRTADRPLPARRMDPLFAFAVGWMLSAAGIIHLAAKVNPLSAILAAVTVATYVFLYTPLKRYSSTNTLVGAIPGAIPPMIGWAAVPGHGLDGGAWFLFALLFLWQLPHFVAISWLCREEYEAAGYRMWSHGDVSGRRCGLLSAIFSLVLAVLPLWPWLAGWTPGWQGHAALAAGVLMGLMLAALSGRFMRDGERGSFRKLFLSTLLYLPIELACLAFAWG